MWLFINSLKIVWMPLPGCLHRYRKFHDIYSVRIFAPQSFAQEIAHNRFQPRWIARSDRCTESTRSVIDCFCAKVGSRRARYSRGMQDSAALLMASPSIPPSIAFGTRKWQAFERDSAEEGREPSESAAIEHNPFESRELIFESQQQLQVARDSNE